MENLTQVIVDIGMAFAVVLVCLYVAYMLGLIFVLRRLKALRWFAFVPIANYYNQVLAINAPKRWFILSLPPYIGAAYAGSVAIRLGAIFHRGPAFSLVWLTLGAPVGMFIIAFSKKPINEALLNETPRLLDIKAVKRSEDPDKPLA